MCSMCSTQGGAHQRPRCSAHAAWSSAAARKAYINFIPVTGTPGSDTVSHRTPHITAHSVHTARPSAPGPRRRAVMCASCVKYTRMFGVACVLCGVWRTIINVYLVSPLPTHHEARNSRPSLSLRPQPQARTRLTDPMRAWKHACHQTQLGRSAAHAVVARPHMRKQAV